MLRATPVAGERTTWDITFSTATNHNKVVDLGEWWHEHTGGLPLPMGGNAIRRDLGEQRLVDLPIVRGSRRQCRLDVRVPREPGILPPGWYMLFLTDNDGVPSHAHWVRVTP